MMANIQLNGVELPEVDLDVELYDEDGYPTEEALEALRRHKGSIPEMVALACALYSGGGGSLEHGKDHFGRDVVTFTTVTMGWSGCESVDSVLHDTLFYTACWQTSSRGGLTVYEIRQTMWESQESVGWGDPSPGLAAGFNTGVPQRDLARIPGVLDALRKAWEAYPDATLAQILVSTRFRGFTEDEEIACMFTELAQEAPTGGASGRRG